MYVATCLPGGRGHSRGKARQRGTDGKGDGRGKRGSGCRRIKQLLGLCISCCHVAISDSALPTSSRLLPVPSLLCLPLPSPTSFPLGVQPAQKSAHSSQAKNRNSKLRTESSARPSHIAAISVFCLQSSVCAYFYCANLAFDWGRPKSMGAWPGHVWLSLLWHYLCSGLDMTATVPLAPPSPSVALSHSCSL